MLSTIRDGSLTRLRFRLRTNGNTSTLIAGGGAIVENQWMHVAAVYDGAFMRLYLDGIEVGAQKSDSPIGYEYTSKDLMPQSENDMLTQMRTKLLAKA